MSKRDSGYTRFAFSTRGRDRNYIMCIWIKRIRSLTSVRSVFGSLQRINGAECYNYNEVVYPKKKCRQKISNTDKILLIKSIWSWYKYFDELDRMYLSPCQLYTFSCDTLRVGKECNGVDGIYSVLWTVWLIHLGILFIITSNSKIIHKHVQTCETGTTGHLVEHMRYNLWRWDMTPVL